MGDYFSQLVQKRHFCDVIKKTKVCNSSRRACQTFYLVTKFKLVKWPKVEIPAKPESMLLACFLFKWNLEFLVPLLLSTYFAAIFIHVMLWWYITSLLATNTAA